MRIVADGVAKRVEEPAVQKIRLTQAVLTMVMAVWRRCADHLLEKTQLRCGSHELEPARVVGAGSEDGQVGDSEIERFYRTNIL